MGAILDRENAFTIVKDHVKNQGLINHMLAVEAAMIFYADKFNQDKNIWAITGLLHDFDWEIHPTIDEHPLAGGPILASKHVPEEIIQAILSHGDQTGIPRNTLLAKTLYACDEITGLITAVALVRPSKSLYDLTAPSVKKKWKDRAFAAGANREMMMQGANEIGIDIWEHVDNVIAAMKRIAPQLGLAGNIQPL